jgi:sugar lactone lactonase YvrE
MKRLSLLLAVVLAWSTQSQAWAQRTAGYGDWQLHLPANRAFALADAGERLYVATDASLLVFDKKLNTTQLLSRRDGLNDVGVAALAYDSVGRQTILAYRNGNIDIIGADGKVRNIPDVVRKNVQGGKTIYHVSSGQGRTFIATSFGLLDINPARLEVRETYVNIGAGGRSVEVYASAFWRDTLYAATSDGLLRGAIQKNLLDFRNWIREPNPAPAQFRLLAVHKGRVYAAARNFNLIYRLSGTGMQRNWLPLPGTYADQWRQLRSSGPDLLALNDEDGIRRLNHVTGQLEPLVPAGIASRALDAVRQVDGSFFVASFNQGLIRVKPGTAAPERFMPNGPGTSLAFSLLADARTNTVNVFSGGYSDRYNQQDNRAGFYEYKDGQWTNFTSQTLPATAYPNLLDLARGTRTPDGTLYIASFGNGVLQWQEPGKFRQYTQGTPSTPLLSAIADNPNFTRITDVAADLEGDVWVVNRHARPGISGLFIMRPGTNTWETVRHFPNAHNLDRLALDDNNVAWVSESRQGGAGLWAVDRTGTKLRRFTMENGLPNNNIYDLVKDRRGFIWVATADGVAISDDPSLVFDPTVTPGFNKPLVLRGEGKGFEALYNETVRCIAVDGANRKWFGTDTGLWLFSQDADEALLHFTTSNSPLPSNRIQDVAVNDKTGEVFVATDAGLVSYQGNASVTEGTPNCAQASPNPVRPGFSGQVGIKGLANNASVKITDVAGRLVYSTTANGGTVTWNLTDGSGRRVRSGVYLVLSADADGKNACVSKVAVL